MPAIALPTINAVLEGAAPHITEPNSKTEMANKKVPLIYTTVEGYTIWDSNKQDTH